MHDLPNGRAIVIFDTPLEGVRHQLFRHHTWKLFGIFEQKRAQSGKALDTFSARRRAGGVHRFTRFVDRAPSADHVEVLEGKTKRIDGGMTVIASRTRAMLRQLFPDRFRPSHHL